ncbi:hypothetical protein DPEC_G00368140 [Dallia pectoralis]|nr:hypothetical protein DPEC_G00368140 [Dallia pectoralis]
MEQYPNALAIQELRSGDTKSPPVNHGVETPEEVQERANETITAQLEQLVLTAPPLRSAFSASDIPPALESASPSSGTRRLPPSRNVSPGEEVAVVTSHPVLR